MARLMMPGSLMPFCADNLAYAPLQLGLQLLLKVPMLDTEVAAAQQQRSTAVVTQQGLLWPVSRAQMAPSSWPDYPETVRAHCLACGWLQVPVLCTEAAAAQHQRSAEVATPGFSDRVHQSMAEQGAPAAPQASRRSTQRPNTVASISGEAPWDTALSRYTSCRNRS